MRVVRRFEEVAEIRQPIHWALGFFDGMHRGHQQVLHSAQLAREQGVLCGMLSFAQHPLMLLCPTRAPRLLTPHHEQKLAYAERYGVDVVLLLDFDEELAALSPERFLEMLTRYSHVHGVSSGANWHFGYRGVGDSELLRRAAEQRGWRVHIASLLEEGDHVISSTQIRLRLEEGALHDVSRMLGRPFSLMGEVIHGQHLARQWNYPTANIRIPRHTAALPSGVYAVDALIGGVRVSGVANLGLRPTIEEQDKNLLLEVHFFDWEGDLYGQHLDVSLHHFLRAEQKFSSIDELKAQIAADALRARQLMA